MSKNIGYHTRLYHDDTEKVCGGSFGGSIDEDAVNRLVNAHFNVVILPSGNPAFVDKNGRVVRLYLSVDPSMTKLGVEAVNAWRKNRRLQDALDAAKEEEMQDELDAAMAGLSHEEIIQRLTNNR